MKNLSIIVKDVSVKMQGNTVLDQVSFQLNKSEHLAITGASDSGKTLLAKALSHQLFFNGSIDFFSGDEKVNDAKVFFVQQHYHFKNRSNISDFYYQQRYNSFDAADTATVIDELKNISTDEKEIDKWLQNLNISQLKNTPLIQLSSGEHKRFQLTKAFLSKPDILILDLPFLGVDAGTRNKLKTLIDQASINGTVIIIIAEELPDCITQVLELEAGKVKTFLPKNEFDFDTKTKHFSNEFIVKKLPLFEDEFEFDDAVKMVDVNVQYGEKKILQDINWQIKKGEHWLLKGSNGAGKSTLLSLINGDNPKAYSNEIYLFDKRRGTGESIWDIKKNIGYVSPELEWYFEKNVSCFDVIASGFFDTIGLFKKISLQQEKIVHEWMEVLNISTTTRKLLSAVSTGTQRLALLARALVKNPSLLILDEPCQGLDAEQTKYFVSVIDSLCAQLEKTLIYVSHYENEIPQCVDKVFEIKKGIQNIYSIDKEIALAI